MELFPDPGGDHFAGAAEALLVGVDVSGGLRPRGDVVGVEADDVPQGAVALEGEELLVVVHVENRLHRVHHPPGDGDADLHGVAQAVVDLLAGVAEGHDF